MRIAATIALALLAGAALAQPAPDARRGAPPAGQPGQPGAPPQGPVLSGRAAPPIALLFVGFDANGDGRTDRAELDAGEMRNFALADTGRDGALGLIELAEWSRLWLGDISALPGRFDFDRDGDDRVSPAEFRAELGRRFAAMDTDKDGALTRNELLLSRALPTQTSREIENRMRDTRRD
jgi:hypothetical protein